MVTSRSTAGCCTGIPTARSLRRRRRRKQGGLVPERRGLVLDAGGEPHRHVPLLSRGGVRHAPGRLRPGVNVAAVAGKDGNRVRRTTRCQGWRHRADQRLGRGAGHRGVLVNAVAPTVLATLWQRHDRSPRTRPGQPKPSTWAACALPVREGEHRQCRLPFCSLWVETTGACSAVHTPTARVCGAALTSAVSSSTACCAGGHGVGFRGVTAQLALELRYAMQLRRDEQTITAPPHLVSWTPRRAVNAVSARCWSCQRRSGASRSRR